MPVDGELYPVNLMLCGKRCLVVGGGRVATEKVAELLLCDAEVHVIAPDIAEPISNDPRVITERRRYREGDGAGFHLIITATDDSSVNAAVFAHGDAAGTWVNSADDPANCSFILPSRIRQGSLLVTFATGGRSPAVATWLRRRFSAEFGPEYAELIEMVSAQREELRASGGSSEGPDWQSALDSGMLELIRERRIPEAKELLRRCLAHSQRGGQS